MAGNAGMDVYIERCVAGEGEKQVVNLDVVDDHAICLGPVAMFWPGRAE